MLSPETNPELSNLVPSVIGNNVTVYGKDRVPHKFSLHR